MGIIFSHYPFLQNSSKIKALSAYLVLVLYHLNIAHDSLELDFPSDKGTAIISCMLARQQRKKMMNFSDAPDNGYLGIQIRTNSLILMHKQFNEIKYMRKNTVSEFKDFLFL